MNYKIVKIVSLPLLAAAFGQAQAMEKSQEELNKALLKAAQWGTIAEVTQLVQNGANVNCKDSHRGWTPLFEACYDKNLRLVKLLLEYDADIDCKDNLGGITALELANCRCVGIAELLIKHSR